MPSALDPQPCIYACAPQLILCLVCVQTAEGEYFCSATGVCVEPTGGIATNNIELPAPTITLIGTDTVYINQGASYLKCPAQAPLDAICDAGATAYDSVEGDISAQVRRNVMHAVSIFSSLCVTWQATDRMCLLPTAGHLIFGVRLKLYRYLDPQHIHLAP